MLSCISASNKSNPEWQAEISKLVGLAHVQSQKAEEKNSEVLRWMAIIKLAEDSGSKEAKKRQLNVVRFKNGLGSEFSLPAEQNLREACLAVLEEVKADWCTEFVSREFSADYNSSKAFGSLVRWADRNASTPKIFLGCTVRPLIDSAAELNVKELGLKELQRHVKAKTFQGSQAATEFFCELTQCVTSILSARKGMASESGLLVSLVALCADRLSRVNPTGFVDAGVLLCLVELAKSCPASAKKQLDGLIRTYTSFAASLVDGLVTLVGDGTREYLHSILPLLEAAFPKFRSFLVTLSKRNTSISALINGNVNEVGQVAEGNHEALCALLIRWRQFTPKNQGVSEDINALDDDIRRAAAAFGVDYLFAPNEEVMFDPIAHRLLDESIVLRSKVRVIRSGVRLTRPDGSSRVLYPALVEPIVD